MVMSTKPRQVFILFAPLIFSPTNHCKVWNSLKQYINTFHTYLGKSSGERRLNFQTPKLEGEIIQCGEKINTKRRESRSCSWKKKENLQLILKALVSNRLHNILKNHYDCMLNITYSCMCSITQLLQFLYSFLCMRYRNL